MKRDRYLQEASDLSYFEIQAAIGTTKHMGGLETTKELATLCHIGKDTAVLDVGCGAGATACYLARTTGCRVVGVDLREPMVALSDERAGKLGVRDLVEFRVADAQALPFDDATFDVILCESVATFIEDKKRVIDEYARVVRPGGYVGLNEEIWIETPTAEMVEYKRTWDIAPDILDVEDWRALLEGAGFRDVVARVYRVETRREASQVKRYTAGDMFRMFSRTLVLYIKNPALRKYMRERKRMPKGLFKRLGYVVLVGRK
ncbi:MAG: class I SAM-dependent methyltransferase [Anaerolineae bacterium]|nr:class I SAM-dependent methyltransferase [Anaerolineae bacterium]